MKRNIINNTIFFHVLITVAIIISLYFRLQLGVNRYFDVDEYTHIHWAYSLFVGEKPYVDFFYIFPPFFLYPIALIISFFGRSAATLIAARIFMFNIFCLTLFILFLIGRKTRNTYVGLLTMWLLSVIPIPYDKLLEVRPDLVAILFAFLGLFLFIKSEANNKNILFFSALSFGTSLAIVPKTIFYLIAPLIVIIYINRQRLRNVLPFLAGVIIPLFIVYLLLIYWEKPVQSLQSITRIAVKSSEVLGKKFYMHTNLFFYPNDTYYAFPGVSLPLLLNLIIYVTASIWGIWRFMSSLSYKDNKKCLTEFILSATFVLNVYSFMRLIPLKHAQYLILIVPFIAFYFADFWVSATEAFFSWINRRQKKFSNLQLSKILTIFALFSLLYLVYLMFQIKNKWTNDVYFAKLNSILATIPKEEPIFDLTGETIFYRNGYYFCCLPYGQYEEAIDFDLPKIDITIKERNTKYIYSGNLGKLDVLPAMQATYIRQNFVNFNTDGSLLIRKDLKM